VGEAARTVQGRAPKTSHIQQSRVRPSDRCNGTRDKERVNKHATLSPKAQTTQLTSWA